MRIGIAGILNKPINENAGGGTETFTFGLVEELVKRQNDVTLFATSDSTTSARLESVCSSTQSRGPKEGGVSPLISYHLLQSREILLKSQEFDIVHNNYFDSYLFTPFSNWLSCPLISTVHNDFWQFPNLRSVLEKTHRKGKDGLVFVSHKARELAGEPSDSYVIHNGIDFDKYEFNKNGGDSLIWLSRVVKNKGAKEAVEAARRTNKQLVLSGYKIESEKYEAYYDTFIKPYLSPAITDIGGITSLEEKVRFYGNAKAFLFPILWEEPFGLVMLEAMSCGTPVIAYAQGAIPEVIKDGVTGFIVNSSDNDRRGDWIIKKTGIDGLCEAIEKIYAMLEEEYKEMRNSCRRHVEENFTVEKMVDNYEKLYEEIIGKS
ncbi:MAG: glycosyltransferase family 4 protein [Candidatus Levyibacteriota bacterium]